MDTLTLASVMALSFISLGLLLYFRQRTKQHRGAAIDQEQPNRGETVTAEDRAYAENFYCIMLTDGTCRPGFMMDPPKQAPDVRTSESKLDDGLTQLGKLAHPAKHQKP
ncbi:hypothetical protein [Stutzerimonas chloritidismutans]|uniref:hypothetical protein n=1 Tax=Stutzerimonas chloritidismutans TaxID=203192 RepID=UPI003F5CEEFF